MTCALQEGGGRGEKIEHINFYYCYDVFRSGNYHLDVIVTVLRFIDDKCVTVTVVA